MPTPALRSALHAALSPLGPRRPSATDADLLASFASAGDESAFAELVRRHGGLVLGASLRAVGDHGTAEDVFQAAFLLLARKASSVSWGPTVGPWLYQAVRRIAFKARAVAARRPRAPLPRDAAAPPEDPAAGLVRAESLAALDEALAALPARLRDPLVLCYLEGLTRDEAAAALRCSPATIKGRVARGRERLRRLLERRGVSLSVALSGLLVSECGRLGGRGRDYGAGGGGVRRDRVRPAEGAGPAVRHVGRGEGGRRAVRPGPGVRRRGRRAGRADQQARRNRRSGRPAPPRPAAAANGDPIPAGAVARFGDRRMIGPDEPTWVGFSPDGKKVASMGGSGVTVWDAVTGRRLIDRKRYDARNALGWRADGTGVAVVVLGDGSHFVSAFTDPNERLPAPPPVRAKPAPGWGPDGIAPFALSPDGTRLAVVRDPTGRRFTIDVLLATTGRAVSDLKRDRTLGPFDGPFREIRYAAGGGLMVLSAQGGGGGLVPLARRSREERGRPDHEHPQAGGERPAAHAQPVRRRPARRPRTTGEARSQ